jgi:hypothetical protein
MQQQPAAADLIEAQAGLQIAVGVRCRGLAKGAELNAAARHQGGQARQTRRRQQQLS